MRTIFLLASAVLLLSAPARAQSPSHLQAAGELVDLVGAELALNEAMDAMIDAQIQGNPDLEAQRKTFRTFMASAMSWPRVRPRMAALYAELFTEAEIRELAAFYRTPTGRKLAGQAGTLAVRGSQIGQDLVKEKLPELMRMMEAPPK
jgi:hypothetical protein